MTNHGSFGVDPGGRLVASGAVMVTPGGGGSAGGGLTLFGGGTLELAGTTDTAITGTGTVVAGTLALNKSRTGPGLPLPFSNNLVIGDNRDAVGPNELARVQLLARDQVPEISVFRTAVNNVTITANGTLDLNGFNDRVGSLTMSVGRDRAAQVTSGAGMLSLLGDVNVNAFRGSSGNSPAARIAGNPDLGTFLSGVGGSFTRNFNVYDTALQSLNPDLVVSANVRGVSVVSLSKNNGGTMLLSGTNTYQGATRLTGGWLDVGSDAAFGNTSMLAISGGAFRAVDANDNPAARTIPASVPLSLGGTMQVFGFGTLTFNGPVTMTGSRTILTLDPAQVTTVAGTLSVGSTGGTLRFSGAAGALVRNFNTITVGVNSSPILDDTAGANADRLPDDATIDLNGGTLRLIGCTGGAVETVGAVSSGSGVTKNGPGFLTFTAAARFPGGMTINADGGSVVVAGAGVLPNVNGVTVNIGGSLVLDNTTQAVGDRLRNASGVSLTGVTLELRGNAATPVNEIVGTITLNSNFPSTVASVSLGAAATLSANQLTRNANSFVSFRGYGQDLGTTGNKILFFTPPTVPASATPELVNGVLPFATVSKAGDVDFAGYDSALGVLATPSVSSLATATAKDNVKLTAGATLASAAAVNAILFAGNGITVGGAGPLTVGSGLVVTMGSGNSLTALRELRRVDGNHHGGEPGDDGGRRGDAGLRRHDQRRVPGEQVRPRAGRVRGREHLRRHHERLRGRVAGFARVGARGLGHQLRRDGNRRLYRRRTGARRVGRQPHRGRRGAVAQRRRRRGRPWHPTPSRSRPARRRPRPN
ncbi:MAG: hypothetical protein K2P78_06680 [Gemmataceae bacterium]|nr:hypothetical protein [Gemmataceae bacterium]